MLFKKLSELAKIDISNVDKKSKQDEKEVKLCNFVDVYHKWALKDSMVDELMSATANDNQISRFQLHSGQVAITKDSETKDDIGMAMLVDINTPNVVLGYHCALITPDGNELSASYLNVVLHSSYADKYFEMNASGSGQRYTLTNDIIGNFPVPMIPLKEQESISDVFDQINNKILTNNAIISELEAMAKDIYDYWFVQFDFPEENGKPYKSSGGKMVWNEELKREIPEGWKCGPLQNICNIHRGASPRPIDSYMDVSKKGIPWVKISDATCDSSPFLIQTKEYIKPEGVKKSVIVYPGTLIVSNSATPGIPKFMDIDACVHDGWLVIDGYRSSYRYYLYYLMQNIRNSLLNIASGSVFKNLKTDYLKEYLCFVPSEEILIKFDNTIAPIMNLLLNMLRETKELASLRDFLLPLLMNGQVKIGDMEA